LKILVLSNKVPYPANDGSSIAIASSIKMLLHQKAEVHLLSLNTQKHFKSAPEINTEKPEGLHFHTLEVNTDIGLLNTSLNLISSKAFHVSRFKVKSFEQLLLEYLKKHRFDCIQIEGLSMMVYLPLLRKNSEAKISLRAHNVEHLIWERHLENEDNLLKKEYLKIQTARLKKFELESLKQIDALIPITEEDFSLFQALGYTGAGLITPCGIEPDEFKPSEEHETETYDAVSLSSMDWMPNVQGAEWFINEVWPIIYKLRPNTSICIAGRDMPEHLLAKKTESLDIQGYVSDMKGFISNAKVCLIPLLAGSGMRIKVLENLAMGKCMVSTTIGAEGFRLTDESEILLADTPETFAQKLIEILDDADKRTEIGINAQNYAFEHFSNAQLGAQLIEFYQNL
jgi:glycosyltransferase involved in cell wall biosynthesis